MFDVELGALPNAPLPQQLVRREDKVAGAHPRVFEEAVDLLRQLAAEHPRRQLPQLRLVEAVGGTAVATESTRALRRLTAHRPSLAHDRSRPRPAQTAVGYEARRHVPHDGDAEHRPHDSGQRVLALRAEDAVHDAALSEVLGGLHQGHGANAAAPHAPQQPVVHL